MSRYQKVLPTKKDPQLLAQTIQGYLQGQGFRLVNPGQNIWQKGMGLMLGPQYVRFESQPGQLVLEAWIKFALLPGVYIGEMGIDGFFAFIPKRNLKARVVEIEKFVA